MTVTKVKPYTFQSLKGENLARAIGLTRDYFDKEYYGNYLSNEYDIINDQEWHKELKLLSGLINYDNYTVDAYDNASINNTERSKCDVDSDAIQNGYPQMLSFIFSNIRNTDLQIFIDYQDELCVFWETDIKNQDDLINISRIYQNLINCPVINITSVKAVTNDHTYKANNDKGFHTNTKAVFKLNFTIKLEDAKYFVTGDPGEYFDFKTELEDWVPFISGEIGDEEYIGEFLEKYYLPGQKVKLYDNDDPNDYILHNGEYYKDEEYTEKLIEFIEFGKELTFYEYSEMCYDNVIHFVDMINHRVVYKGPNTYSDIEFIDWMHCEFEAREQRFQFDKDGNNLMIVDDV